MTYTTEELCRSSWADLQYRQQSLQALEEKLKTEQMLSGYTELR